MPVLLIFSYSKKIKNVTVTISVSLQPIYKKQKMKTFKLFSLFVAASLSLASVNAQTADEVVNKHIEAIGGAGNWKKVNSVVQTGTMSVQGMNLDVINTIVQLKGSRQDITAMGMANYMIVTPTAGWRFFPIQGQQAPEPITEEELKENQENLDIQGSFLDYKTKGHTVELLGKEEVDGTECYKVKLTSKAGKPTTYFIDTKTYLVLKSTTVAKANGQEAELSTTYSNYQKLPEGITFPMAVSIPFAPGMNLDFAITKVEINKAVDEAIFKPSK